MEKVAAMFVVFLGVFFMGVIVSFMLALPVMWLWNWIIPDLLHLPELSWTHAWGLSFLTGLLFKTSATTSK